MKRIVGILVFVLVLAACGGGAGEVTRAVDPAPTAAPARPTPTTEVAAEAVEVEGVEEESAEAVEVEGPEAEDVSAAGEAGERPYSGIDSATGLAINPDNPPQGQEFMVRGELISANLTPMDSPEFVVRAPSGKTYRMRAQAVNEIYFEDGVSQLRPHEFQRGVEVQATVLMPAGSSLSDVLQTEDFTIIRGRN